MRAIQLTAIRKLEMREVPDPKITGPNDVLLKMSVVGVCGSDVHYYETGRIGSQVVEFPFTLGHEGAGVVLEVGSGVKNLKPGDRVAIEPAMSCHTCDQCLSGRENTCRKLRFLGCPGQAEGCISELLVMPAECCFKIKETTSMEAAAFSEPLAIGVYAVKRSVPMKDASIAILGMGTIGLSVMMPAMAEGCAAVYCSDKIDERVETAEKYGAKWAGNPDKVDIVAGILEKAPLGVDVVYECCGQQEALDQALDLLKPGGKLILVGIPTVDRISFTIDKMRRKEITLVNIRRQNHCPQLALDLIESGKVDINQAITHRFKFEQTPQAFELVASYDQGVIKAMLHFD